MEQPSRVSTNTSERKSERKKIKKIDISGKGKKMEKSERGKIKSNRKRRGQDRWSRRLLWNLRLSVSPRLRNRCWSIGGRSLIRRFPEGRRGREEEEEYERMGEGEVVEGEVWWPALPAWRGRAAVVPDSPARPRSAPGSHSPHHLLQRPRGQSPRPVQGETYYN